MVPVRAADAVPWLELVPSPAPIVVDRGAAGGAALVSLELVSRVSRAVRVESVAMTYLKAKAVVGSRRTGVEFFRKGSLSRADKVEAGSRESWTAICLDALPAEADTVRFDVALALRRGAQLSRSVQTVDVAIAAAPAPVLLRPPFRGHWRVTQGHGCTSNHRLGARGAEFAWDFATIDRDEGARRAADGASFGREVLSPVAGRVVRVVSDIADNRGLTSYPRRSLLDDLKRPDWVYGNYVVIESDGRYVLLAHLELGSAKVDVGAEVAAGTIVARVGNSGNAINAHLHLHVMDGPDPGDPTVRGVPARLADYVEIRTATEGEARELVVRRMSAGDPPEGSVVAPDLERSGRAGP